MKCPSCGGRTRVYDSRSKSGGVQRRRQCKAADCQEKFTTLEQVAILGRLRRGTGSARRSAWAQSRT